MNEDLFRILCLAIRKIAGDKPIQVSNEEWSEAFELKMHATSDGFRVQILDNEDE